MTKVLIISYYWPPSGGAGVQRWLKFVKFLPQFNVQPHVYTALNGEMPVVDNSLEKDVPNEAVIIKQPIWEPYSIYKRFIGRKKDDKINASFLNEGRKEGKLSEKVSVWIRGNFFIPDARRFWIRPSISFLADYIQKENIDCIISTGPPHSMHLIASGLKKKYPKLIWLADFRDPWTNIDFYDKLMLTPMADAKHRKLEAAVLKEADCVISIGEGMNTEFKAMLNTNDNKFVVITNGYDNDDVAKEGLKKDAKFSLAHIGTLVKDRNPEVLWQALRELVTEHADFKSQLEIKLVGKVDVAVNESLAHYNLENYVRKIAYLPHAEVVVEQQASHVNLLLVNNTPNAKGILTGKFFEYLAAGAPILAIGPTDGDLAAIMKETNCGYIADFNDKGALKQHLLKLFKGEYPLRNKAAIEQYSRKALTKKLVDVLEHLRGRSAQSK